MDNKLLRFPKVTLVLGAATLTLLCLPFPTYAQSSVPQDRQAVQVPQDRQAVQVPQDRQAVQGDDITRRDLARFDQFLDSHRAIADQLRRTPSSIDDPQFLQSHPELNAYLQDHPSVRQEISGRPDTFMRLEDLYARDANLRDRDAGGPVSDADRRDMANRNDGDRRDAAANFDRFLDEHREIGEQVRKDPVPFRQRRFCAGPSGTANLPPGQPGSSRPAKAGPERLHAAARCLRPRFKHARS